MKPLWLLAVFFVVSGAGCGPKSVSKAPPVSTSPGQAAAPVNVLGAPRVERAAAAPAALPPPRRRLSEADLAYLRWLIQFDTAVQQILVQQAHDLPRAMQGRGENRLDVMLKSWQDSRQTIADMNTNAARSDLFAGRLREVQEQFQSQPAPPNCRAIAQGYSRFLTSLVAQEGFNGRIYRQFGVLLQNPRAGTAMLPADLQDGGVGIDSQLTGERQGARQGTNAALSALLGQFPDDIPADIAGFQVP
jgi:hypothetical protein